jgi:hypothetical protein
MMFEGRSLAFIRVTTKGIWIWVPGEGREDRLTVGTVAEAAKVVKTSDRRQPKAKTEPKAS